jgi:glycosyltransferase involved in cell wall biosynthesis
VLTTSAFGSPAPDVDDPALEVVRAWEPVGLYRRLRRPGQGSGLFPPSYERTDPGRLRGLLGLARRFLLIPDGQVTWVPAALVQAARLLRRTPVELLYSSHPPASGHLLALLLKWATGLPWVADFRDGWTSDPLDPGLEHGGWRLALEQALERAVVRRADAVVAATEISAAHLRQLCGPETDKVKVIPNGFDPEALGPPAPLPPLSPPLRLVHTGAFRYSHPRRTPFPLLAALDLLLAEDPAWAGRLQVVLVGQLTPEEEAATAGLVQAGLVELVGPQPREEALRLQAAAHLLLLVDHVRPWPASNVPGKLYEYLAAGRPVLALCGPGMVQRLLSELDAGRCVAGDDPVAIAAALRDLYRAFVEGRMPSPARPEQLLRFHRSRLAGELAACFDQVLAKKGTR